MATNNVLYFNAALAGAAAGLSSGWNQDLTISVTPFATICAAIATEVDSLIPVDGGPTASKANLINQLVAGTLNQRNPTSVTASTYAAIGAKIAAEYTALAALLQ